VSFEREKRLLLGWLAILAPLPLPFNEVLGWGGYLLYALAVGAMLLRARRDPERWMPVWLANALALAYLPFLAFDLLALSDGRLVGPMLHLGLFAVAVKLWSLRRERDKWHAALGIFFLFVAAAATSVHLSVILYLLAFLGGALLLLSRFAYLHLLAGFGRRDSTGLRVPMGAFLGLSVLTAALVAVPLFALLPRVRSPYLGAGGRMALGGAIGVSGFTDEVTLDTIGSVRTSREVALRLTYDGAAPPAEIRLKGGAFDRLEGGRWSRAELRRRINGPTPQVVALRSPAQPRGTVEVWLQPLYAKGLPVPVETLRVEVPLRHLEIDEGGALSARSVLQEPLQYEVAVGGAPLSAAAEPQDPEPQDEGPRDGGAGDEAPGHDAQGDGAAAAVVPTLDLRGVSPRMTELAAEVAGDGPPARRAERLERFFIQEFDYTLDLVGRASEAPIEDFLFTYRRGHCEYFASAMVLLLRAQGIHARLVTGFLGGELNPLGYVVVRQANAHAWVEAWIPGEGWRIFDPTPPAGRPAMAEQGLLGLAAQVYDSLVFQWDRYVLTYGVEDQMDFTERVWHQVRLLIAGWTGSEDEPAAAGEATAAAAAAPAGAAPGTGLGRHLVTLALLLVACLVLGMLWRRYRGAFTATRAYGQLRGHLARSGLPLSASTGPLALSAGAAGRWPAAAPAAARVVDLYLRESFGSEPLDDAERQELRIALEQARRALRATG
jgi:protein-glutamine gamma-glutamyltransferase